MEVVQENEKYSHLLVGTVKGTQIMFSFFVEASIIDQDPTNINTPWMLEKVSNGQAKWYLDITFGNCL